MGIGGDRGIRPLSVLSGESSIPDSESRKAGMDIVIAEGREEDQMECSSVVTLGVMLVSTAVIVVMSREC